MIKTLSGPIRHKDGSWFSAVIVVPPMGQSGDALGMLECSSRIIFLKFSSKFKIKSGTFEEVMANRGGIMNLRVGRTTPVRCERTHTGHL